MYPAHSMLTKHDYIVRGSYLCEKYINIPVAMVHTGGYGTYRWLWYIPVAMVHTGGYGTYNM